MRVSARWAVAAGFAALAGSAHAAEVTTYSYDAQGRLVAVSRQTDTNTPVQTGYSYDLANNRTQVTASGH